MGKRLLIVDDEYMILEGLKRLLPYQEYGISNIETAENAEEALEVFQKATVDIVLTDVCMPDKTGLDMIAEMKLLSSKTHYIIMSGYQEFDFVKQALSLGALDYLVKPIRKSELIQVLSRLAEDTQEETSASYREVLEGKVPLGNLLQSSPSLYLLATLTPLDNQVGGIEVVRYQDRIYYYLTTDLPRETLLYYEPLDASSDLSLSYERVERLLFYDRLPRSLEGSTQEAYEMIFPSLQLGRLNELCDRLPLVQQRLKETCPAVYLTKQFFIQLMTELHHDYALFSHQLLETFFLEVEHCSTLDDLVHKTQHYLAEISKKPQYSGHVMDTLTIIREEYQSELTLKEVSERLFLNTVYLGQLIKKETGQTFATLLNDQRIRQAKRLLLTTNLGVEDICFSIGYTNVGYFYKIFKRFCGQSPNAYRKGVVPQEEGGFGISID